MKINDSMELSLLVDIQQLQIVQMRMELVQVMFSHAKEKKGTKKEKSESSLCTSGTVDS